MTYISIASSSLDDLTELHITVIHPDTHMVMRHWIVATAARGQSSGERLSEAIGAGMEPATCQLWGEHLPPSPPSHLICLHVIFLFEMDASNKCIHL